MFSIYMTLLTSFAHNTKVNMRIILTRLFGFNKLNFEDRHTRPSLALTPSLIMTLMKPVFPNELEPCKTLDKFFTYTDNVAVDKPTQNGN